MHHELDNFYATTLQRQANTRMDIGGMASPPFNHLAIWRVVPAGQVWQYWLLFSSRLPPPRIQLPRWFESASAWFYLDSNAASHVEESMSTETQRAELPDLLPELMKLADAYAQAFNKFGSSTYNPRTASERAFLENNLRAAFAQAAELAALRERLEFAHAVLREEQERGIAEVDKLLQQAKELAALKADIAEYVRAASEQATEIEALRNEKVALVKMLTTASAHLHWARRNARCDTEEMTFAQVLKEIDGAVDAAMQTKEES